MAPGVIAPIPDLYVFEPFMLVPPSCLAVATIIQEAALEPYRGKVAVAKVIRNRMRKRYSSDGTVAGTVLHPYQFSGWNTTDRGRIRTCQMPLAHPAVTDAIRAWFESVDTWPEFEDVVLYHANAKIMKQLKLPIPTWASRSQLVTTIGNHLFYKER